MRRGWETELQRLRSHPEDPARPLLKEWIGLTKSYWPGLFHCYVDDRIPRTNNEMERFIKELKTLERRLSQNPNPAVRFNRNAPVNAAFANRAALPGFDYLACCSTEEIEAAKKSMKASRRKTGIMRLSRKNLDKVLDRAERLWCQDG